MKNVKKFLLLFLLFCFSLQFSYSENYYKISETELQQLEILNNNQRIQINELKNNFQSLKETMKKQEEFYQEYEKANLKKKIKIGSISFSIGLGIGALSTGIIIFCLNK